MTPNPPTALMTKTSLLAAVLVCGPALGAFDPGGFTIVIVSTAGNATPTNTVTPISNTLWSATGGWSTGGASVSWTNNTQGWNPATNSGFTNGNFVVRNESASAQDYSITIGMMGSAAGPLTVSGSVGGQFLNTSFGLGSLTSVGPLWETRADNNVVRSELNNALFVAQPFQVMSLGDFSFNNTFYEVSVTSSVSLHLSMRLSAGSEASFTSTFAFQAVPAPGAVALVALAGAFGRRRRRR